MPLHGYVCQDCQHRFEYLVRNTRQLPPQVDCPNCGSGRTFRATEEIRLGTEKKPDDKTSRPNSDVND